MIVSNRILHAEKKKKKKKKSQKSFWTCLKHPSKIEITATATEIWKIPDQNPI
jgi:hypothetical protein